MNRQIPALQTFQPLSCTTFLNAYLPISSVYTSYIDYRSCLQTRAGHVRQHKRETKQSGSWFDIQFTNPPFRQRCICWSTLNLKMAAERIAEELQSKLLWKDLGPLQNTIVLWNQIKIDGDDLSNVRSMERATPASQPKKNFSRRTFGTWHTNRQRSFWFNITSNNVSDHYITR